MHARHSIPAAVVVVVISAVSAFAQATSAPGAGSPEPRFYVAAIGGAVSRPPTAPVFGVEVAQNVGRRAQAFATLSYFENLMRQTLRDGLDATATRLATLTGEPWSLSGRDRGVAFVAGARYVFSSGSIRPYVGAGAGIINLKRTVFDPRIGDVTRAVFNDFDLGEADLTSTEGINRPLIEAAFGVGIGSGRTHFDIGYRYRTAYRTAAPVDFSQVSAGIGYRF
jgi:hypothetical protein